MIYFVPMQSFHVGANSVSVIGPFSLQHGASRVENRDGGLKIRRLTAKTFNTQSRTADKW